VVHPLAESGFFGGVLEDDRTGFDESASSDDTVFSVKLHRVIGFHR